MKAIRTDAGLADWFSEHAGERVTSAGVQFFGLTEDGEVKAVFAFGRFCGADVEMGVVTLPGTRWPRSFLNRMFHYIFIECGCCRVTLHAKDDGAARLMERIGAVREGVKRHAYGRDKDAIVMGLFPENYRLMRPKHVNS